MQFVVVSWADQFHVQQPSREKKCPKDRLKKRWKSGLRNLAV